MGELELETKCHQHIDRLVDVLNENKPLIDANIADFLTRNLWNGIISRDLQTELENYTDDQLVGMIKFAALPFDSGANSEKVRLFDDGDVEENDVENSGTGLAVRTFIRGVMTCYLQNMDVTSDVADWPIVAGLVSSQKVHAGSLMSEKKSHEMSVMSQFCATLYHQHNLDLIIDVGSGKGYFGSDVAIHYGIPVLGIESSTSHTHSAKLRHSKLVKTTKRDRKITELKDQCNNVSLDVKSTSKHKCDRNDCDNKYCHENHFQNCHIDKSTTLPQGKFVTVSERIDENTNISHLVSSYFGDGCLSAQHNLTSFQKHSDLESNTFFIEENSKTQNPIKIQNIHSDSEITVNSCSACLDKSNSKSICENGKTSEDQSLQDSERLKHVMLTGLHACGALTSDILRLFVKCDQVSCVCVLGCCYNLLSQDDSTCAMSSGGFPLSAYLRSKHFHLTHSALNLGCQSLAKISRLSTLQGESFFNRALLPILMRELAGVTELPKDTKLRKCEKRSTSTLDYMTRAFNRVGLPTHLLTSDIVDKYIHDHACNRRRLSAFCQLRLLLAPCIEAIILLDRLLYLLEQEVTAHAHIVHMFDDTVSPRSYAIVARKIWKKTDSQK